MGTAARQSLEASMNRKWSGERRGSEDWGRSGRPKSGEERSGRLRVFVAAENRLLRDALSRLLCKRGDMEVVGLGGQGPFQASMLAENPAEILLLASRGNLPEDLRLVREVRLSAPETQIVMIGGAGEEREFLQYVRAGIRGYRLRIEFGEGVIGGFHRVQPGGPVCPGSFGGVLSPYFNREATTFP